MLIINNINAHVFNHLMKPHKDRVTNKIYREFNPRKGHVAIQLWLILTSIRIWGLLSYINGQESYAQQTPPHTTDFFLLEFKIKRDSQPSYSIA